MLTGRKKKNKGEDLVVSWVERQTANERKKKRTPTSDQQKFPDLGFVSPEK